MNNNKKSFGNIGFYILIFVILLATVLILLGGSETSSISYAEVKALFRSEQVEQVKVQDNVLYLELNAPYDGQTVISYPLAYFDVFYYDLGELIDQQYQAGIIKDYDIVPTHETPWWVMFIPYLVIAALIFGLWFFMMNRAQGGGGGSVAKFSKARARLGSDEKKKVTFRDVAGADEEKEELQEIVAFLKNPKQFTQIGARIPKGVLLVGPPGTGKTLLAKAVAGEAGVQFLSISGSDFVEMYVGVGASRVRDLFEQAKKMAPAIVFIDEIDAVGRKRGAGLGGGHDEREQTLNQLLVEMDGFGNNEGVIVMAATNRADILDNALLRPGRFDRTIYVGEPDSRGREEILKIHARGKPLADDVKLDVIARTTSGFTGADLENLLNESALLAARSGRQVITMADVEKAMIKVIAGPEKRSRVVSPHERRLTAVHEAGHAIVSDKLTTHIPVHQITIIPRGQAGGMTIYLPTEDHNYASRNEMFENIVSLLGGRVAEAIMLDDISTGASNDIQRATSIARQMVSRYGMSDKLGTVCYDDNGEVFLGRDYGHAKSYSERVAGEIDDEVQALIHKAYTRCEEILREHMDQLQQVSDYLLEHETMSAEEFAAAMGHPVVVDEDGTTAAPAQTEPAREREEASAQAPERPADDSNGELPH